MLQEIAKVLKLPFDESNEKMMEHLRRIERNMPLVVDINARSTAFKTQAVLALVKTHKEGPVKPKEEIVEGPKVLKIKSVPKGERLETVAPNGVRYSFGPKWNDSVIRGKGIAVSEANREKLNYQGTLQGVADPEKMSTKELAAAIALTLGNESESQELAVAM